MRRIVIVWVVLAVVGVALMGLGSANQRKFQFSAIEEAEKAVKAYFLERKEDLLELGKPDYSLGRIEMTATTDKAEYVLVLFVTNPDWVTLTALNLAVAPTVTINSAKERT